MTSTEDLENRIGRALAAVPAGRPDPLADIKARWNRRRRRQRFGATGLVLAVVVAGGTLALTAPPPGRGPAVAGAVTTTFAPLSAAATPAQLAQDAGVLRARFDAMGVPGAAVSVSGGTLVVSGVTGREATLATATPVFLARPVLCGAAPSTPANGSTAPVGLPTGCSDPRYALTAGNLGIAAGGGGSIEVHPVPPDPALTEQPSTTPAQEQPSAPALLDTSDGSQRYLVGPAGVTGADIASASVKTSEAGQVLVDLRLTPAGSTAWDQLARAGFHQLIAFEVDGVIVSAPLTEVGQSTFSSFQGELQISGGFTTSTAESLATELDGALPAPLVELGPTPIWLPASCTATPTLAPTTPTPTWPTGYQILDAVPSALAAQYPTVYGGLAAAPATPGETAVEINSHFLIFETVRDPALEAEATAAYPAPLTVTFEVSSFSQRCLLDVQAGVLAAGPALDDAGITLSGVGQGEAQVGVGVTDCGPAGDRATTWFTQRWGSAVAVTTCESAQVMPGLAG